MSSITLLLLLSIPAVGALSFSDGALTWYVTDAFLVCVLCLVLAKQIKDKKKKLVLYFCSFYHTLAATYGVSSDTGAVSTCGLLILLCVTILILEYLCQANQPKKDD